MKKSTERIALEQDIHEAHNQALDVALQMVEEEFDGDMDKATQSNDFIQRVQARAQELRDKYLYSYRELEMLEQRENYPAMWEYARILDTVAQNLPEHLRHNCYYPFSGTDFYWARIFSKLTCEDIGFDQQEQIVNMWWGAEAYSERKREEIISLLKKLNIIAPNTDIQCVSSDVEESQKFFESSRSDIALLIKGGHDIIGAIKTCFGGRVPEFGAIITVSSANPIQELTAYLKDCGYQHTFSHQGTDWIAPHSMELRNIHVFLKNT